MTSRGSLLLLDSASMYFRAFFGVPDSVRSPDGQPIGAVRGFLEAITLLLTTRSPSRLVACWDDDWRPAFRVAAIPSYKAHRVARDVPGTTGEEEVPDALSVQVPVIVEALAAIGIPRIGRPGYEADDVIGTFATLEAGRPDGERSAVEIVTGDRDLFQLVDDDAPIRVLYTARGMRDLDVVDVARLRERYGVASGAAYADMAALRGDPSDGLPGVPGIGEKTAVALLNRYGDLAGVLRARDDGDPGLSATQRKRLTEAAGYLDVAPTVVQVARDVPVGVVDDALPTAPADPDALDALAERWGLGGAVSRLVEALAARAA
ncbi:5'-3' exonuclease [Beutenbergia cavernae DSM 12333]|uniref:5'-3' exonuclease n=1 Tax=Beutenbergia cavernae (strain ATCC BAA-8 / DSM 12333 / CCUG 43141 / JCM 11478 / NBRC 16432 / NCIMB 13614 / HKI 0122) TaxID=471853 RepID=C5C2Q9_BEUC1|nr:5'-3' exonuclease H3TH domain-containing protein [Beutenbergia cavernae]ACQ81753.1 5'-3' exonuclease [Beutenbergia cavernae DSM 12333]